MGWPLLLAGLVGAGGQIGGGLAAANAGKTRASDLVSSYYNPALDYALQAANYDALNQIGWGNLDSIPDPFQQLTGQLENIPLDVKTRRRALTALQAFRQDPTLITDPMGKNFTPAQIMEMNKTGNHPGRIITRSNGSSDSTAGGIAGGALGAGAASGAASGSYAGPVGAGIGALVGALAGAQHGNDTYPSGAQTQYIGRLKQALNAAGVSTDDLLKKLQEQKDFEAKIQRFKDAGLPQLAEQMVIDRAKTTAAASGIAAAGANYAQTGDAGNNPLFQQLQAQDQRNMDRFATRAGLQANFGGSSQAAAQKAISDAQLDQNLRVLQGALTTSGLLQATMAPGTQAAAGASSGQLNSAQIAAQQAMAANNLRQNSNQYVGDSFGNAIGNATSTLGTGLSNYALTNALSKNSNLGLYQSGYEGGMYGPGSTQNQMRTSGLWG